jgi:hypothetical protein
MTISFYNIRHQFTFIQSALKSRSKSYILTSFPQAGTAISVIVAQLRSVYGS